MAQARELISVVLFNGQAVYSKRLFEPETTDMGGKPLDKPSFSINVRFPKTKANWYEEPLLKPLVTACQTIMARDMVGVAFQYVQFPIKDGDAPNKNGKVPDFAKGHWIVKASSTYAPKVEQMVNGVPSELQTLMLGGRKLWGDGDYIAVSLALGKRLTDNVGIKAYLNSACFTGKGVELATGGGAATDWAAAMELAKQAGIEIQSETNGAAFGTAAGPQPGGFPGAGANPAGFGTAPGPQPGFGQPQGDFNPQGAQTGFNPQPGGFNPAASVPFGDKPPF